jgi:hypothetical protein
MTFVQRDVYIVLLCKQVALLSQNVQVVTRERQKLEKEAITFKDQQTTAGKAITSLSKQKANILAQYHEKEVMQCIYNNNHNIHH